jgi:hypothetical protein
LAKQSASGPVPVSRWDRATRRKIEAVRDKILGRIGTNEKLIEEQGIIAPHWRKPLSITEINRMAPTPEVRRREGRP